MGSFLVMASAFGFSTLAIFGKIAYQLGFTRNQMLMWRFGLSLPFLFLILCVARALPKNAKIFSRAVLLGVIGIGIEATLFFITLEKLGAALTGIFLYLYPAFVALISHFFLKEKMSNAKWACIVLSLVGCILTVDLSGSSVSDPMGVVFGVLTGLWYAIYLLTGNRIMKDENPLSVGSGIVLGSFVIFAALSCIDVGQGAELKVPADSYAWFVLMGMALLASVVPFTTLYAGMKRVGPTQASILSTLEMVFTIILAAVFLGEKLTVIQAGGAFLILLSVLLIQKVR